MGQEKILYSLSEILKYAFILQKSMGVTDYSNHPQAFQLANEPGIVELGGCVNIPDWRRKQLEVILGDRKYSPKYYYAVEEGLLPDIEGGEEEK